MRIETGILYFKIAVFILIPLILLLLPSDIFDEGSPKCLSVLLLNQECFGCGTTRACMHFIHFEFSEAIAFNPLVLIVFPLLAFLWLKTFLTDVRKLKNLSR